MLNERLLVLQGRKVVAFPDIDGYDEWQRKLADYPQLCVTISPILQQNATQADPFRILTWCFWGLRSLRRTARLLRRASHILWLGGFHPVSKRVQAGVRFPKTIVLSASDNSV